MPLLSFVLSAMHLLAPARDHSELGAAIARVVEDADRPLYRDDAAREKTAGLMVAIGFRESSLRVDAVGDHGESFCAYQVHRSSGGTRALLEDAHACVAKAFELLRESIRVCPSAPVAWYAEGGTLSCSSARAQRISRDREGLGKWLVAHVEMQRAEASR